MLRVSICDDDVATLSQLEELVRQYLDPGELCLATYSGYGEFLTTRNMWRSPSRSSRSTF